jgi:hypothetical protein
MSRDEVIAHMPLIEAAKEAGHSAGMFDGFDTFNLPGLLECHCELCERAYYEAASRGQAELMGLGKVTIERLEAVGK